MPSNRVLDFRWTTLFHEFRRSGLTQVEFCKRRGLSIHTFRKQLYTARAAKPAAQHEGTPPARAAAFLPVTILPDPSAASGDVAPTLEVILHNGRRIAVLPGFDPETLRRLLTIAEDRPCSD